MKSKMEQNDIISIHLLCNIQEFKLLKQRAEHHTLEEQVHWQRESALNIEVKKQNEQINERIKRQKEKEREQEELENIKVR